MKISSQIRWTSEWYEKAKLDQSKIKIWQGKHQILQLHVGHLGHVMDYITPPFQICHL